MPLSRQAMEMGLRRYLLPPRHEQKQGHDMKSGGTTCRSVEC
jgi:hypothetical protein